MFLSIHLTWTCKHLFQVHIPHAHSHTRGVGGGGGAAVPPFFTTSVHMSLQLRLTDDWLPRLFRRFLAASFRWNVPSSCRGDPSRTSQPLRGC